MIRPALSAVQRMLAAPVVTRFAPSPTGYLHLGHVVNAIYVWGLAQVLHGHVLIRIEDHDRIRSRPVFEDALLEDLQWLGFLEHAATTTLVRQRDREEIYRAALERLRGVAHIYACDCSRATIPGELYPGHCRRRGLAERAGRGLRLHLEPGVDIAEDLLSGAIHQDPSTQCGDVLIKDRDGHWTYQFAVTVDDFHQRVTLVIRGDDLRSSTGRQVRLGALLARAGFSDTPWPPHFLHHPLVLDAAGVKLSKSTGATGVRHLRATGLTPGEVIGMAAAAVGLIEAPTVVDARSVGRLMTVSSPPR